MTDAPLGGSAGASGGAPFDAVSTFERHRAELKASKRVWNLLALGAFTDLPRPVDLCQQLLPRPAGRGRAAHLRVFRHDHARPAMGRSVRRPRRQRRAVPGSITFWYTDFWTYIELLWETILMAITATLIGHRRGLRR
jgi:phosphonate transport system permease protein